MYLTRHEIRARLQRASAEPGRTLVLPAGWQKGLVLPRTLPGKYYAISSDSIILTPIALFLDWTIMVRIASTVGIAMTTAVAVLAVIRCHWLASRTDRGPYDGNFLPIAPDIFRQGYLWEASAIKVSWDS